MHEDWEGKRIAREFAEHISRRWRSEGDRKSDITSALEDAIRHFYGSKETFFTQFLAKLNPQTLQQFYTLLYEYLREYNESYGGIDPLILAAIRDKLQKAGVSEIEQADASKSVSPSTRTGKSTPGRGGNRSGRR